MDPYSIRARILNTARQRVEERGWTFIFTPMLSEPVNYGYSVGFFRSYGFAEAVVVGVSMDATAAVLGGLAEMLAAGGRPACHVPLDLGLTFPIVLRPVPKERARSLLLLADEFYGGTEYPTVQAVWPDVGGRFPWESGFVRKGSYQPLLFDEPAPD